MTVETQLNPTQPVNQQIYRILRRDIVHCLIAPGTPLSEKEVSVRFNVSRQPVREAFIKLAENGLIQIRPQRGSYVNKISMAQVRNGSFIRQAIECAVARRAASMITESQCYQLEQNLHQQRIAIERKQLDDFFELDDNFHQLLTQIADCQLAWDTIENLKATVDRVRYMSFDHVSPSSCRDESGPEVPVSLHNLQQLRFFRGGFAQRSDLQYQSTGSCQCDRCR